MKKKGELKNPPNMIFSKSKKIVFFTTQMVGGRKSFRLIIFVRCKDNEVHKFYPKDLMTVLCGDGLLHYKPVRTVNYSGQGRHDVVLRQYKRWSQLI